MLTFAARLSHGLAAGIRNPPVVSWHPKTHKLVLQRLADVLILQQAVALGIKVLLHPIGCESAYRAVEQGNVLYSGFQ
jgi:hypothetical protein